MLTVGSTTAVLPLKRHFTPFSIWINVSQPAGDNIKIILCRCSRSQCSLGLCRCNLSVEPRPGAPAVFWLIVPVISGHLVLSDILHITSFWPNKRHTPVMHAVAQANRGAYSTHGDQHTQRCTNKKKPFQFPSKSCSCSQATLQGIHYYWCQNPQQEVMAEPPAVCTV